MHGTTRPRTPPRPVGTGASAVVWIGRDQAIVLREADTGGLVEAKVEMPGAPGATPLALAELAHRIGEVDHVLVLGSPDMRTALEREIVAIGHAPDTIREADAEGPLDREVLLERLHRLA